MRGARALAAAAVSVCLLAGCGDGGGGGDGPTVDHGFDEQRAYRDVVTQVKIGPRPSGSPGSRREVAFIASSLERAGLSGVRTEIPLRNVVVKVGSGSPAVVIGAHHDTKDLAGFVGANDGASGVAVVLELARVVRRLTARGALSGTYIFVFFDGEEARGDRPFEEDGLRGSRQFVRFLAAGAPGWPPLERIEAMYLLDMVGDCDLHIPREANSDPELYAALVGEAFGGETGSVLDDHIPFIEAGVPAVDIIDFDFGPGPAPGAWWHTTQDTLDKVCAGSLGQAGDAVLGALLSRAG